MKTILYAEDDGNDVVLIMLALRGMPGIKVQIVRDGAAAINYLAGHGRFASRSQYPKPNLVFLDIKMPRLTGLEVLGWLHEQAEYAETPIVMMSSSEQEVDVTAAYRLGASNYLIKPSGFDQWRSALRQMMRLYLGDGLAEQEDLSRQAVKSSAGILPRSGELSD